MIKNLVRPNRDLDLTDLRKKSLRIQRRKGIPASTSNLPQPSHLSAWSAHLQLQSPCRAAASDVAAAVPCHAAGSNASTQKWGKRWWNQECFWGFGQVLGTWLVGSLRIGPTWIQSRKDYPQKMIIIMFYNVSDKTYGSTPHPVTVTSRIMKHF